MPITKIIGGTAVVSFNPVKDYKNCGVCHHRMHLDYHDKLCRTCRRRRNLISTKPICLDCGVLVPQRKNLCGKCHPNNRIKSDELAIMQWDTDGVPIYSDKAVDTVDTVDKADTDKWRKDQDKWLKKPLKRDTPLLKRIREREIAELHQSF